MIQSTMRPVPVATGPHLIPFDPGAEPRSSGSISIRVPSAGVLVLSFHEALPPIGDAYALPTGGYMTVATEALS